MPKRPPPRPPRKPERPPPPRRGLQAAELLLWLVVLVPPLVFVPTAKESFRLPKLMVSEWLALASLLPLCWELRRRGALGWHDLRRLPALWAVAPALLVATLGLATSAHPAQTRDALADLWIAAACLVGWSAGLPARRLERPLAGLLAPGAALALLAALQFHGLYRPLQFVAFSEADRLAVTSLAGNPGDLGAYLLLACLAGVWWLARAPAGPGRRGVLPWAASAALALCLYALALTQTLAALAALAAAGLVFAALALPPRRAVLLLGGGLVAAVLLAAAVPPLRARLLEKRAQVAAGQWNDVLTGRLDGWRAALWMAERRPWTGVGQGAFAAEFVPAKEALLARGTPFFEQERRVFGNAHNDLLEVAATWGLPGLAALLWGVGVAVAAARRAGADAEGAGRARLDRAFAAAGLAGLAVLALVHFPFRTALVGYPALLFLAWLLRPQPATPDGGRGSAGAAVPGAALAAFLGLAVLAGLVAQTDRLRDRLLANRILRQVELVTIAATRAGGLSPALFAANLAALRRAAELDPTEVGIPIARGGQYLLLRRPQAALEAYREALAIEPRPEVYLNQARAYHLAGDAARARQALERTRRLDPILAARSGIP